jgi:uncharacterized protein (PEP-CTERM system associated)
LTKGASIRRGAALAIAGMALQLPTQAVAQSVEYFGTPWIYEPVNPLPGQATGTGLAGASLPTNVQTPTAYSNIFGFATQVGDPRSPAWQFTPRFGTNEIFTDNVRETRTDKLADLESEPYVGFMLGADTSHLTGLLDYAGVLQENIHDNDQDRFSNYGFLTAHATVIPGAFYVDLHGSADDVLRSGGGVANPTIQNDLTQTYVLSASPYYVARLGNVGFAELRYQLAQAWFAQNTGEITTPGSSVGPVSASTQQQLRVDFRFPGTFIPRFATYVTMSSGSEITGSNGIGTFWRNTDEVINEYQLTRSVSLIGGGGYEKLGDRRYPLVTGEDGIWDFGGRWQPNADSSLLLVYGRHDLNSDVAAELQYRITPFTSLYVAYTNSIGTAQQSLIANNDASLLNPAGPVSGITFDQSSVLATLNDAALAAAGDLDTVGVPLGIPLSDVENFAPLQNDIFRSKLFRAILYTNVASSPVSLTVYDDQQISLARMSPPETTTKGVLLSWTPSLAQDLFAFVQGGYNFVDVDHARVLNAAAGLHYNLSESLSLSLRYDWIDRTTHPADGSYTQNAITLSIGKNL